MRAVAAGDTTLAAPIARRLIEQQLGESGTRAELRPRFTTLTAREREIVRRLARGLSNAALANELGLSEATVKTHITRLLTKLDVRSRVQAVVLAYESGFVRPGHTAGTELYTATRDAGHAGPDAEPSGSDADGDRRSRGDRDTDPVDAGHGQAGDPVRPYHRHEQGRQGSLQAL